jgi:hypothetical protein
VTPAETTAAAEEEVEKSAMMIPPSYDEADSAEIPLEAEPAAEEISAAVEPVREQEFQAAEKVAEPPEAELLEELAAGAESPDWEAEATGVEPPELEAEAAVGWSPASTGAVMDVQPRVLEAEDATEAEPSVLAGAEDVDLQSVPETEGEITPAPAWEEPVETKTEEAMLESAESIPTYEPESMEPAAGISQPPMEEPQEAADSELPFPPEDEPEIVEMEASAPVYAGSQAKIIESKQIINNSIKISRQREDHLLITVGDVVFLPTPGFKTIRPQEKYFIYKKMKKRLPGIGSRPLTWFEKVGKLKILEINNQLSIARVIAAHDIIEKGDVVYLSTYP